jgi:hypothetical protein
MHHLLHLHPRQFRPSGCTLLLIGCALLVIGCPLLLGVRDVRSHNLQLARVADSLYGRALPPNTVELDRTAYVASIGGSGDACDYVVEQTLQTSLSRSAILTYYQASVASATTPYGRGIARPDTTQYYQIRIDGLRSNLIVPTEQPAQGMMVFTLQLTDGRDDAGLDIRCL